MHVQEWIKKSMLLRAWVRKVYAVNQSVEKVTFCVLAVQVMANSSDLISIHQFNIHRSFSVQVMHFIRMNKKEITTSLK